MLDHLPHRNLINIGCEACIQYIVSLSFFFMFSGTDE